MATVGFKGLKIVDITASNPTTCMSITGGLTLDQQWG